MIVDYPEVNEAIIRRFSKAWTPTRIQWTQANEKFKEPASKAWAEILVEPSISRQASTGQKGLRRFDRLGTIYVQIYTPAGSRTKLSAELTKIVVDAFEGNSDLKGCLRFGDVTTSSDGVDEDKGAYRVDIDIDFSYEIIK